MLVRWRKNILICLLVSFSVHSSTQVYSSLLTSTQVYSSLLISTYLYSSLLNSTRFTYTLHTTSQLYSTLLTSTQLYSPLPFSSLVCCLLPISTQLYSTLLSSCVLSYRLLVSFLLFLLSPVPSRLVLCATHFIFHTLLYHESKALLMFVLFFRYLRCFTDQVFFRRIESYYKVAVSPLLPDQKCGLPVPARC